MFMFESKCRQTENVKVLMKFVYFNFFDHAKNVINIFDL